MLSVVADANVLISAALARSPNAPSVLILDAALDGRLELITSPALLREIAKVLARPRLLTADEALRFGPRQPDHPAERPSWPASGRLPRPRR
ncbi:MAG TPA: PIN domain-containing protein [Solirubrobacteraceae bacterium]|jgi:predicted nucleic acid-binding protein|nr:PIN domain-containing protein [Solirubrobacteraceae bacterium]